MRLTVLVSPIAGRRALPVIAAALAAVAAGSIAHAADGADTKLAACVDVSSGVLRLVTPERPCDPARGQVVEWSQAGPAGPPGVTGPAGAPGPEGQRGAGLARDVRLEELTAGRGTSRELTASRPRQILKVAPEDRAAEAISATRQGRVAVPDDYSQTETVVALALPRGHWVITGKTTATVASALDYVDHSKGSAYCTLVAGDDRDGAGAHRASLNLMVTHRYARAGVVEIRCVGTPDTIVAASAITALRVGKLTKQEG